MWPNCSQYYKRRGIFVKNYQLRTELSILKTTVIETNKNVSKGKNIKIQIVIFYAFSWCWSNLGVRLLDAYLPFFVLFCFRQRTFWNFSNHKTCVLNCYCPKELVRLYSSGSLIYIVSLTYFMITTKLSIPFSGGLPRCSSNHSGCSTWPQTCSLLAAHFSARRACPRGDHSWRAWP